MSMHGVCTCGKVVQTAGTDEAQVVMHSQQMVYHGPLILTFFPTPQAEGRTTSTSQGLRGIDPLEAHDFW